MLGSGHLRLIGAVYKTGKMKIAIAAIAITAIVTVMVVLYRRFDPLEWGIFPKCPFKMLTGYDCPGCGSQRAIHALLNGDMGSAFKHNPLLIIGLPYMILGLIISITPKKPQWMWRIDSALYHDKAVTAWIVIIVFYTIWRNTPLYPFAL